MTMCGIGGAVDAAEHRAAARVRLLNAAQEHRGPDHSVLARVGGITLGNTRLAIRDPTPAGNQPFVSPDGRYHCVFNGEIYNHRLLAERYQLSLRTTCDGAVIPALWAKLGEAALGELRGMFAIALVDSLTERLYLARDRFGIKPLYWRTLPDGSLAFASEARALARAGTGVRVDPGAVTRYLYLGAMAADQAPFLEISSLPPGSVCELGQGCPPRVRPLAAGGPPGVAGATPDLGAALLEATDLHLAADVPAALLLSGGVDSAAIAAASRRLGRDLQCVTVGVGGPADETAAAARTARQYGHSFHPVAAALDDGDIAAFFRAMQRPSIDGLNMYLICKAVHEAGFKVALSGLGGDEAVGGYSHFRLRKYLACLKALDLMPAVAGGAARLAGFGAASKAGRLLGRRGPRDAAGLTLLQREVLPSALAARLTGGPEPGRAVLAQIAAGPAGGPPRSLRAMISAEVVIYLQAMLLADADTYSMASSVELRVPFVDRDVFAAALSAIAVGATPRWQTWPGRARPGKAAIGGALGDPYLGHLACQAKQGFSLPMKEWLAGRLAPLAAAACDPAAAVWSVLDRAVAQRAGLVPLAARDRWAETWVVVALNAWLETLGGSPA
jgi:asparagine synthase (glutamine-hydrolysing)